MKKRKYLFRLIAVVILLMIFPVILFFDFFWKKSFDELEKANEAYYNKVLDSYISLYDETVRSLNMFAASISTESREQTSLLWNGIEELGGDYLQLYKVSKSLEEKYSRSDVSEWGIYLHDVDKIIKPSTTMSSMQFIYGIESRYGENEQLSEFFSLESYTPGDKLFCTTSSEGTYNGYLVVGICIKIGENDDKALVWFALSPKDIEDSLIIMNEQGMEFYLIDEATNQIMLAWGDNAGEDIESVISLEEVRKIAGREQKVLYRKNSAYTEFSIWAYVSEESLQNNIIDYVYSMRKLLVVTFVVLIFICLGAIYIVYKPVYKLTTELDYSGESEFEAIRNLLDDRHSTIKEQEMLIMDLLLNHLVYGVHVSEKRIKRLGVDASMRYYCVFLLEGYVLTNGEVERLADEMAKEHQSRLFVTDWEGENSSVFILFLKNSDVSSIEACLRKRLRGNFIENCDLYVGKIVDRLDDIQMSLRSCFEQAKKKAVEEKRRIASEEGSNAKEEVRRKLKEEVLAYLELNYRDADLNQAQVADMFRISNYTLSRLFKNQVGVGFTEYLVAKRIEYAKELLLTTSHSVSEISTMAGFSGINHFSKSFKLYVGMSPTAFRKQV
ncbi:MAG: helix-turn-helix transcriptional regulator [Lachnospiraceae bacterium]|nr:helix-turn-helix transcriptional regulator [Lachnospiraceae bacterium]